MRLAAGIVGLGLCLAASAARAEDPSPDQWHFMIAPYLWATSLDGDVTVKGRKASVHETFIDILQETDSIIGFEGHGEAWKGDWGLYLDGVYTKLGAKANPVDAVKIKSTTEMSILEGGALYRVGQWDLGSITDEFGGGMASVALETYAGARYTSLDQSFDISDSVTKRSVGGDKSWVDPLVGARTIVNITDRLQLMAGADIGGFDVGSE